jgi:hypothetical protein
MNRPAELPVLDAEPIADVFRRICWLIPNDPGHAGYITRAADQSLSDWLAPLFPRQFTKKPSMESPPHFREQGRRGRQASLYVTRSAFSEVNPAP